MSIHLKYILLLIAFLTVLTFINADQKSRDAVQLTENVTTDPESKSVPGWRVFRHSEFGIELSVPKNWLIAGDKGTILNPQKASPAGILRVSRYNNSQGLPLLEFLSLRDQQSEEEFAEDLPQLGYPEFLNLSEVTEIKLAGKVAYMFGRSPFVQSSVVLNRGTDVFQFDNQLVARSNLTLKESEQIFLRILKTLTLVEQ